MRVGEVVRATRGREAGCAFFVVGEQDEYLLLADGRHRRLEQPKRKKRKHVKLETQRDSVVSQKLVSGDKVTNKELWRALADYREE